MSDEVMCERAIPTGFGTRTTTTTTTTRRIRIRRIRRRISAERE